MSHRALLATLVFAVLPAAQSLADSLTLYAGTYNGVSSNVFATVYDNQTVNTSSLLVQSQGPQGTGVHEGRGVFEFSLAGLPSNAIISSASLGVYCFGKNPSANERVAVGYYPGDGTITSNDFSPGTTFYTYPGTFPLGGYNFIDATAAMQTLAATGATWAGFNMRDTVQELQILNFQTFYYSPSPSASQCPKITITYSLPVIPGPFWNLDASGSWNVASNWGNNTVPNAPGAPAILGSTITAPRTVAVNTNVTIGSLRIDSPQSYTIAGPATLTLDSGTNGATANLNISGAHAITAPVKMGSDVHIENDGSLAIQTIDGPHAIHFGGYGTTAITSRISATAIYIEGAALDIKQASMVLTAQSEDDIRHYVNYGQLVSSDQGDITFFGVITNNNGMGGPLFTTFAGVPAPYNCTLIRYTYFGDTNFDGQVDAADVANLVNGMNNHLQGWINGDIDYSGTIDAQDFEYIREILPAQGKPFPDPFLIPNSSVPEAGALVVLPVLTLLSRRRLA